jgi:hypothetical protein
VPRWLVADGPVRPRSAPMGDALSLTGREPFQPAPTAQINFNQLIYRVERGRGLSNWRRHISEDTSSPDGQRRPTGPDTLQSIRPELLAMLRTTTLAWINRRRTVFSEVSCSRPIKNDQSSSGALN